MFPPFLEDVLSLSDDRQGDWRRSRQEGPKNLEENAEADDMPTLKREQMPDNIPN